MTYRTGPVGALMDEYERAASELKAVLAEIPADTFVKVLDEKTKDEDCRSIQTIMHHVVSAGYGYSNYIRKHFKTNPAEKRPQLSFANSVEAIGTLDKMLVYTAETLEPHWDISDQEVMDNIIEVSWGQRYDFEQLLEHAIVHILRHRRQIERFLQLSKNQ